MLHGARANRCRPPITLQHNFHKISWKTNKTHRLGAAHTVFYLYGTATGQWICVVNMRHSIKRLWARKCKKSTMYREILWNRDWPGAHPRPKHSVRRHCSKRMEQSTPMAKRAGLIFYESPTRRQRLMAPDGFVLLSFVITVWMELLLTGQICREMPLNCEVSRKYDANVDRRTNNNNEIRRMTQTYHCH